MSLDPIRTTRAITDAYLGYLLTTFQLRDEELRRQFREELWVSDRFVKGPILEATPPFVTGRSLEQLVQQGILSESFRLLSSDQLPLDRPLYWHQEQAILKAVAQRRNLVLATGTGSGKTEAFLVPILNHIFLEKAAGRLCPGVRALLLYPMNALANDQVARLRHVLENSQEVTFGRYTGETKEDEKAATEEYRHMYQRDPLPNELVSRERMRQEPPHILLTNYAMLEYLLLRPADNVFFDGPLAAFWRHLVIDEAHTYTGAKGIEMAMLLRRLKDRVTGMRAGALQCILTSATLGRGEGDFPEVSHFAELLLGERVEWVASDASKQDVIGARRRPLAIANGNTWKPAPEVYERLLSALDDDGPHDTSNRIIAIATEAGLPRKITGGIHSLARSETRENLLHRILSCDGRISTLRQGLEERPMPFAQVAAEVLGEPATSQAQVAALVELAARSRSPQTGEALLPARYHLFARAVEGAFVALRPVKRLFLERLEYSDDVEHNVVFELATCRQCGAAYLVGEVKDNGAGTFLRQSSRSYGSSQVGGDFFLLLEENVVVADDEDEIVGFGEALPDAQKPRFRLCARCGAIDDERSVVPPCSCGTTNYLMVAKASSRQGRVHTCLACGARSPLGLVSRFRTGSDATASVLVTALYEQIPPREQNSFPVPESGHIERSWSSTASDPRRERPKPSGGGRRQLLVFSDSRQDAAFFAPYVERTHAQIIRRRVILRTIEDHRKDVLDNRWRIRDLVNPLRRAADDLGLFAEKSPQEQVAESWKWLLYELLAFDRRSGLEGTGCLGFALAKPAEWRAPDAIRAEWDLTEDEVWTLFQILLDTLRKNGAVLFPDEVSPQDPFFCPRNREYYARGDGADSRAHIYAWNPSSKGLLNSRLDFLHRFVERISAATPPDRCREILARIWSSSIAPADRSSCWHAMFSESPLEKRGVAYRLRHEFWELRPTRVDPSVKWYHCDSCGRLSLLNLRGVCPAYRCFGRLHECEPANVYRDNHYRKLYTSVDPLALTAREHTAQLTSQAAAALQTDFINGKVNVLSCSTTFELGVDVGQLECVLMRNVPPTAANYVQRAGRAGRRTASTAFAATFAQLRSHDLSHYREPERMVSGTIRPPHFALENEKIVRRHMYATALASFWRAHPETFGTVQSFFLREEAPGPALLGDFLRSRPTSLLGSLRNIVPEGMQSDLALDEWGWVDGLISPTEGVLTRAADEVSSDVQRLRAARQTLIEQHRPSDFLLRSITTIERRYLLGHLSSRNVIPKYGFPVDVVELDVLHHSEQARDLELNRDLRIALSEYAPSGQVVAAGRVWTSRYLKRPLDRGWLQYEYAICAQCGRYQRVLAGPLPQLDQCQGCGHPLSAGRSGTFVIPEFGFMTAHEPPTLPGDSRPDRTSSSRVYFSGEAQQGESLLLDIGPLRLEAVPARQGLLAVINDGRGAGFKICPSCGYAVLGNERVASPHRTPWTSECRTALIRYHLGHEFRTDILLLRFKGYTDGRLAFWLSLLYGLLEGASSALDIDRGDIDGCLYPDGSSAGSQTLVLFDDVPGGAGHVRRIADGAATLLAVLAMTRQRLSQCECGGIEGDTSCYGCLRNYDNQFCHDEIQRGMVIRFLQKIGV